ncbi:hypothetical protein ABS71_13290 [bacterium SCN 62-11]|nr:GNAT family N-acetyltransferase [Candidatus Eremiobacteraeota bacterium]ODT64418.1 MAG: hypothetical protein ABS71_13290 [bacterium SCN 62-11]
MLSVESKTDLTAPLLHFRELESDRELLDYFRLRHLVYCKEGYLEPRAPAIDLDAFDCRSRFVGAFSQGKLVAGGRMILPGEGPHRAALERLTAQGQLPQLPASPRSYHSQEIFDLKSVFNYCRDGSKVLVEFGRVVVDPELRSSGLGLKLIHALHGLALHRGVELGFAAVPPKLRGFYEKSGCRILDNKGVGSYEGITTDLIPLVIDLHQLGGVFRVAYRARRHLARYGFWQVCSEPHCLEEHRHLPEAAPAAQSLAGRLPAVEVHGWEPALQRLPLLREGLQLHDETLRDGLQSPSVSDPSSEAKGRFLDWLLELGVQTANLGLPGAGGRVYQHTEDLVGQVARRKLPLQVTCAGRTHRDDVLAISRIAQKSGLQLEAGLFLGCSPLRQMCEQWDLKRLLELTDEAVRLAVAEGLSVMFVTEDTSRTPPHILEPLYHTALQAGASAICITDTVGHATPHGAFQLVRFVREFVQKHGYQVRLDWHGHNDRGLAVANCLAAIEAGADRVHATALGVGERVGNASMERLLLQLHRLSGRPLKLPALRGYLGWAARHLEQPIPTDLVSLLNEPNEMEGTHDEPAVA